MEFTDIFLFITLFVSGLAVGWVVTWEVLSSRHDNDIRRIEESYSKVTTKREENLREIIDEKVSFYSDLLKEKDESNKREIDRMQRLHCDTLNSLQKRFDETVSRMQAQLESATSSMLKQRQTEFQASSTEKIENILRPLRENIIGMKEAMATNSRKQDEFSGLFSANIQNLLKHGEATRASAERLANALKRNGKIQGEWGETILTELLEGQGLVEGIHFDTQTTLRDYLGNISFNRLGKAMRPDVILHLDKKRDVIIDAKVSLSDYLNYVNASTTEEREAAAIAHVASLERHVRELSKKDYSSYLASGKSSIGYVIMFVPNTSALLLATTRKPDLWRNAMEKNVYIADEQTLYAALKIVTLTWSQITQTENLEQLFKLADEMMTRVKQFMERYVDIGKKLDDAKKSWDGGMIKLRDSGQSIPQTCSKIIKLGVKRQSSRTVPDDLLGIDPESRDPELPAPDSHDAAEEDSSAS